MYLTLTFASSLAVYSVWTKLCLFPAEVYNLKEYVYAILVPIDSKHDKKFSIKQYLSIVQAKCKDISQTYEEKCYKRKAKHMIWSIILQNTTGRKYEARNIFCNSNNNNNNRNSW